MTNSITSNLINCHTYSPCFEVKMCKYFYHLKTFRTFQIRQRKCKLSHNLDRMAQQRIPQMTGCPLCLQISKQKLNNNFHVDLACYRKKVIEYVG